jgi:hypothetical protein
MRKTENSVEQTGVSDIIERTGSALAKGRYPMEIMNNNDLYRPELRRIFG